MLRYKRESTMKYSDGIVQSGTVLYYLKRVDVVKV